MKAFISSHSRIYTRIFAVFIIFALVLNFSYKNVKAATVNLISNESVETVSSNPSFPEGWNHSNWGTNTPTYEYTNDGFDGSRSVKIAMSAYSSGDAKWYFNPVSINPSTNYFYSDNYKSDVSTDIVAEITTTSNTTIYQYIGNATPSTIWKNYSTNFTTPSNAQSITIFHLISSNGYLQTDSFMLSLPQTVSVNNGIPNNSLEEVNNANPSLPLGWNQGSWGTNSPVFSYLNTGHTGSRSIRIDMNSYSSGDAKWYYNAQSVTPNQNYTFSDYYMSNVSTDIVAEIVTTSNTYIYLNIGHLSPANTWTQPNASFTAPASAKTISIFHLLNSVGFLTTDDYSLTTSSSTPTPTPTPSPTATPSPTPTVTPSPTPTNTYSAEYFDNQSLTGTPKLTRSESNIDYDWGGGSPDVSIPSDHFSARWTKITNLPSGNYRFTATADDGIRISLDNSIIIDKFIDQPPTTYTIDLPVNSGDHTIKVEYYENGGGAVAKFSYLKISELITQTPSSTPTPSPTPTSTPVVSNGIPNNSLETTNSSNTSLPLGWNQGSWGNNTHSFSYNNSGHTGSRSVRVDITSYTDGDVKWVYDAQPVTANTEYLFSDYYMSNVDTQIVAEVLNTDNTYSYITLGYFSPQSNWTQAKGVFSASSTAKTVTIFHLLNKVGYLATDDYAIGPYQKTGFNRAIVSINFDDGWRNAYTNGLPILTKYGIQSTQYIISGFIGTSGYVTKAQILDYSTKGHEIGSHTIDHPDLTTLTNTQITSEFSQSKQTLEALIGKPVISFAAPYGTYNNNVINISKNYYSNYRTTDVGYMYKTDFDQYRIKTQNIESTTTVAQVKAWVDQAIKDKSWLVLVYHEVSDATGQYKTKLASLDSELSYIKNTGVKVSTMKDAITELTPQL